MRDKVNWVAFVLLVIFFILGMGVYLLSGFFPPLPEFIPGSDEVPLWVAQVLLVGTLLAAIAAVYLTAKILKSADIVLVTAVILGVLTALIGGFAAYAAPAITTEWAAWLILLAVLLGVMIGGLAALRFLVTDHETCLEGSALRTFMKNWAMVVLVVGAATYGYRYVNVEIFLADVDEIEARAEAGDLKAQMRMGGFHRHGKPFSGRGLDYNPQEAIKWFGMAADAGSVKAMDLVGTILHYELGDPAAAAGWYRRAAEMGQQSAQWVLGNMYEKGEGVPLDPVRAYMWHSLSTNNTSQKRLAGILTPEQIAEAERMVAEWREIHEKD